MKIPDKLYLDTNIVERYFKSAVLSKKRGQRFKLPFIFLLLSKLNIELFTSSFVLAEVFEHLWKRYSIEPKNISELTQNFLTELDIYLILGFSIKANILRWIRKRRLEAKDVVHLTIAMSNNLCLLSHDEKFVDRASGIYEKIILDKDFIYEFSSRLRSSHPK